MFLHPPTKKKSTLSDGLNFSLILFYMYLLLTLTTYFDAKTSDKTIQRVNNVRNAFNSPFRPFVLATTSVGQEGLDFHLYSRKVVHWNLPSNPIDVGRILRTFKIKKNVEVTDNGKDNF